MKLSVSHILKQKGRIVKHEDYFFTYNAIAEEVTVKKILAFCQGHLGEPLREGIAVNIGNPYLHNVCSYEAHKKKLDEKKISWFGFYYDESGKITFDYSNQE